MGNLLGLQIDNRTLQDVIERPVSCNFSEPLKQVIPQSVGGFVGLALDRSMYGFRLEGETLTPKNARQNAPPRGVMSWSFSVTNLIWILNLAYHEFEKVHFLPQAVVDFIVQTRRVSWAFC